MAGGAPLRIRRFVIGGFLLGSLSGCGPSEPERSRPPERAVWIERAAWTATEAEERALRLIGPRKIFLAFGDLDLDGDRLRWASEWGGSAPSWPGEVIVVVGGTKRFVEGMSRLSDAPLAERMGRLLREAIERVRRAGVVVSGLHLDVPAGGAVEPYGRVLARVRAQLPRPLTLSATIPVGWERERALSELVRKLDFYVVRVASDERPADLASLRASVDVRDIGSWIRRFDRLGVPFYVEGRAQGRCVLLDPEGAIVSAWDAVHPLELLRRFGFRIVESSPLGLAEARMRLRTDFSGEYVVVLEARTASRVGGRLLRSGDRLACRLPTAHAMRRQIEAIEGTPSMWKRGVVLWSSGRGSDGLDLPLAQIALVVRGGALEPKVRVRGELRESSLVLRVENVGNQESALMSRAVEVRLRIEGAAVRRIERGDFAQVERAPPSGSPGVRLTFSADGLREGDVLRAAVWIEPRGARVRVFASSRVWDPDEFIALSEPEAEILSLSR